VQSDWHARCAKCGTELAPHALSCPACLTLVHGAKLKDLAASAESLVASGSLPEARERWETALRLLPPDSRQHTIIRGKVDELTKRIAESQPNAKPAPAHGPWWRRGITGIIAVAVLFASKLKFLLLGLTKASTFLSMFAFFGVYWTTYGWPLALGMVVSIYIHEMGHVSVLRKLGIEAGAPLFIPGVGALVMLKQHIKDPIVDAKIGLAGPLWGMGAGIAAYAVFLATGARTWLAISELTGLINLFNLIPVWQLDGSRGFHALSRTERGIIIAIVVATYAITHQKMLILIGAVAVYRAFQKESGPGDRRTFATYLVLLIVLTWLARGVGF
jgi:Zn-dependent protease